MVCSVFSASTRRNKDLQRCLTGSGNDKVLDDYVDNDADYVDNDDDDDNGKGQPAACWVVGPFKLWQRPPLRS